jgi:hypothetical protein
MTTSPDHPMDAVYHTLLREAAAIQEQAQGAQRLHHLMRHGSQEYRENKPLFTCPTRQHLLAPRPCPHGACLTAAPACQGWLLVRPPGWPPASRAAHHAGSKRRPAAAKTGANGWELWQWGWHEVTVDNALAHAEAYCGAETGTPRWDSEHRHSERLVQTRAVQDAATARDVAHGPQRDAHAGRPCLPTHGPGEGALQAQEQTRAL